MNLLLVCALFAAEPNLDFDLLGAPATVPASEVVEDSTIKTRRTMLLVHQVLGFSLLGLMAGTLVTGQMDYYDRFMGPSTARFHLAHKVMAYSTFALFFGTGAVALLAPSPFRKDYKFDTVMVHRIGLFGATAGMIAQLILGIVTVAREGYVDQAGLAAAHLAVGYATGVFMAAGVTALLF